MPDSRAGNAIDDFIEFAESLGSASVVPGDDEVRRQALSKEWQESRGLAHELTGLPEDEAIKTYLSWNPQELQSATGQWIVRQGWPHFAFNDSRHDYRVARLGTIKNRILEYLHDELKRGAQVIEGYADPNLERWVAAPSGSITFEALKKMLQDPSRVELSSGGARWRPRLATRQKSQRRARREALPSLPADTIREEIRTFNLGYTRKSKKVPSARTTGKKLKPELKPRYKDHKVSAKDIEKVALEQEFVDLRRDIGQHD
jgi:hypothetical protein